MAGYKKTSQGGISPRQEIVGSAELKAQTVLEILYEEKALDVIAAERGIYPNMLRNWKREFLDNAASIFDHKATEKDVRRKEAQQDAEREQMIQAIGQLTMERNFLQRCFRKAGKPISDAGVRRKE